MAPLYYRDTAYLVKLWYLEEKNRLIRTIFYFKRHKCRRSTKPLQKLFKGRKAAKSFERSFGTWLTFKIVLDLEEFCTNHESGLKIFS